MSILIASKSNQHCMCLHHIPLKQEVQVFTVHTYSGKISKMVLKESEKTMSRGQLMYVHTVQKWMYQRGHISSANITLLPSM
eukprot:10411585-Ditylum_brightwellii.AAC.1